MDESNIAEKNLTDEKSQNPNRSPAHRPIERRGARSSTGPTSPEGKARSSMNRLTHGCRSDRTVLPFEDPNEWEFTLQSWMQAYDPQPHTPSSDDSAYLDKPQAHRPSVGCCASLDEDPTAATLVFEAARAQWILRNQQRLDETESGLPPDAIQWTDDHIKRYNHFLRYKTTAERSFYRAFNNLEAYYQRQAQAHRSLADGCAREKLAAAAAEKARAQMAKIQMQWLKEKAAVATGQQLCARQWVEVVTNSAGECITTLAPSNETLAELLAARSERAAQQDDPRPFFVSRFVNFLNGVPPAYDWLQPNDPQRYKPCIGVQQFTDSGWLRQIETEKRDATGHLAPYATGLLIDD